MVGRAAGDVRRACREETLSEQRVAGKAKTVKAKVTRKGRKAIAARRKHRVTVVLTSRRGGAPVSRQLTLGR